MTDHSAIPILNGERIVLRPFTNEDAPAVNSLLATPEIAATTLNVAYPYPDGAAAGWISTHANQARQGLGYVWALTLAHDQRVIGTISLGVTSKHARGTLGYWLGVDYWNRGYMSEAARIVVRFAFEKLALHRVEAACLPRNTGSSRVMEKAGMTYEGILRGYYRKQDHFEDIAMYAILGSDAEAMI